MNDLHQKVIAQRRAPLASYPPILLISPTLLYYQYEKKAVSCEKRS